MKCRKREKFFRLIYIFHFERKMIFLEKKMLEEKYRLLPCGTFHDIHSSLFTSSIEFFILFFPAQKFDLFTGKISFTWRRQLHGREKQKDRKREGENDVCCLWKRDMPKWKCLILWHLMKINWILWGGFLWKFSFECLRLKFKKCKSTFKILNRESLISYESWSSNLDVE